MCAIYSLAAWDRGAAWVSRRESRESGSGCVKCHGVTLAKFFLSKQSLNTFRSQQIMETVYYRRTGKESAGPLESMKKRGKLKGQ